MKKIKIMKINIIEIKIEIKETKEMMMKTKMMEIKEMMKTKIMEITEMMKITKILQIIIHRIKIKMKIEVPL